MMITNKKIAFMFSVILIMFCLTNSVCALNFPSSTRQEISLSGDWQCRTMKDANPIYPAPEDNWKPIKIPCSIKAKAVFFKRTIIIPEEFKNKHIRLEFDSVIRWCKIYFNGEYLGENFSGLVPISIDITNKVKYGELNELILWVTMERTPTTDTSTFGGYDKNLVPTISRNTAIVAYPVVYIEDVFIKPSVRKKELNVDFTLVNSGSKNEKVVLCNNIIEWKKDVDITKAQSVLDLKDEAVILPAGEKVKVSLKQPWNKPHLWSHEDPFLYVLRTEIILPPFNKGGRGGLIDTISNRFGFREFWIEGTNFILNGIKVHLYGPWYGPWEHTGANRQVFEAIRKSNMNAMRYPHATCNWDPTTLDITDEVGILICSQNTALGFGSPYRDKQEFWNNMEDVVRRGVRRDRNHPSVIMWSMSNEWVQGSQNWQYQVDGLWRLQLAAREEDPTRPAFQSGSGALNDKGEVISLHYPYELVYGGEIGKGAGDIPNGSYWWENAKRVRSAWVPYDEPIGKKPIIITESNYFSIFSQTRNPEVNYYWTGEKTYELAHFGNENRKKWEVLIGESTLGHSAQIAGIRDADIGGTTVTWDSGQPSQLALARFFHPNAINIREMDNRFFIGDKVRRTLSCYNDLMFGKSDLLVKWQVKASSDTEIVKGEKKFEISGGEKGKFEIEFKIPDVNKGKEYEFELHTESYVNGNKKFEESIPMYAYPKTYSRIAMKREVYLFDMEKNTKEVINKLGIKDIKELKDFEELKEGEKILIIGKNCLDKYIGGHKVRVDEVKKKLEGFTEAGGIVVILEQEKFPGNLLPVNIRLDDKGSLGRFATTASILAPNHPIMTNLKESDFRFWRGDHFLVKHNFIKPKTGNFIPLIGTGNGAIENVDRTPLVEIKNGKGGYIISQMLLVEKFETEPKASVLLANILNYADTIDNKYKKTGILLDDNKASGEIEQYFKKIGVNGEFISGNEFSEYEVIITGLDKEYPNEEQLKKLNDYVNEGGTLLALNVSAQRIKEISLVLGERYTLEKKPIPSGGLWFQTNCIVKTGIGPLFDGISNGDMYWHDVPIITTPFINISGPDVKQLVDKPLLTEVDMGKGKIIICQIPLTKEILARRLGSILLTNLGVPLGQSEDVFVAELPAQKTMVYVNLRPYCNMGFKDDVSGDKKGGWTDQGNMDMRNLPVGVQTFNDVSFDIISPEKNNGKSCIVLRSKYDFHDFLPNSVNNMEVNEKNDFLYFLIADAWTVNGTKEAKFIIRYVDLFTEEINITGGKEVIDWINSPSDLSNAEVAWSENKKSIYMVKWKNPKPNNKIMDISFISETNGVPILIAVTGTRF